MLLEKGVVQYETDLLRQTERRVAESHMQPEPAAMVCCLAICAGAESKAVVLQYLPGNEGVKRLVASGGQMRTGDKQRMQCRVQMGTRATRGQPTQCAEPFLHPRVAGNENVSAIDLVVKSGGR